MNIQGIIGEQNVYQMGLNFTISEQKSRAAIILP